MNCRQRKRTLPTKTKYLHFMDFAQKGIIIENIYDGENLLKLEYLKICNIQTLKEIKEKNNEVCIALIACFVGETRLIDNMILS